MTTFIRSKIKTISTLVAYILQIIFTHFHIQNVVVFESFNRRYDDSPKAVSEALHSKSPDSLIIWIVRDTNSRDIPSYVKTIRFNSIKHLYYKATAKVYVDNYVGKCTYRITKQNAFLRKVKREGQFNISIWHGTPLKKLSNYNENDTVFSTSDLFISGSDYNTRAVLGSFRLKTPTLCVGLPRNDILFNFPLEKKAEIRKRLGIPIDKKYVLFAPTFRADSKLSSVNLLKMIDVPLLLNAFSKRFGGDWVLAFRVHPRIVAEIVGIKKDLFDNIRVFDGNLENDMSYYLVTCDALISDYSGSLFDIALTDTPSFIFCKDINDYSRDRGFIFPVKDMPQSTSQNLNELVNNVLSFNSIDYRERNKKFLNQIGNAETGCASESVAKLIIEKISSI